MEKCMAFENISVISRAQLIHKFVKIFLKAFSRTLRSPFGKAYFSYYFKFSEKVPLMPLKMDSHEKFQKRACNDFKINIKNLSKNSKITNN